MPQLNMENMNKGFSLVELMVAIALGLLVVTGLVYVFANSSRSYGELQKSAQQIENGRYAMNVISDDLRHAGYYGDFALLPPLSGAPIGLPGSVPDPCLSLASASLLTDLRSALPLPVQGYDNQTSVPSALTECLGGSAGLKSNTDILVIRRADTAVLVDPDGVQNPSANATAIPTVNEIYIQSSVSDVDMQKGVAQSIDKTKTAANVASTLTRRDFSTSPVGTAAAYIRKYHLHVYFVSNCRETSCAGGNNIPTLKRAELVSNGTNTIWRIVPLVEGIENLQLEYGLDAAPAAANTATGMPGDGAADSFVAAPTTVADWANVVSVRVFILARNIDATVGYVDNKSYTLKRAAASVTGATSISAPGDAFKRHVYEAEVPVINAAYRRMIP